MRFLFFYTAYAAGISWQAKRGIERQSQLLYYKPACRRQGFLIWNLSVFWRILIVHKAGLHPR